MTPGDIVTVDFPGVMGVKRRPAVVVSTPQYHRHRPDIIVALITSQLHGATTPLDYVLQDWQVTGFRRESACRAFLMTLPAATAQHIGHCSDRDWRAIQTRLARVIDISGAMRVIREGYDPS
jgi:mRNA interferase MazF